MKITINHDTCKHSAAYADRCLAATIRNPLGHERYCMAELIDDGHSDLTITLIVNGQSQTFTLSSDTEQAVDVIEKWLTTL